MTARLNSVWLQVTIIHLYTVNYKTLLALQDVRGAYTVRPYFFMSTCACDLEIFAYRFYNSLSTKKFKEVNDSKKWALTVLRRLVFLSFIAFFSCKKYSLFITSSASIFRNSSCGIGSLWRMKYTSARLMYTSAIARRKENGRCYQCFAAQTYSNMWVSIV